MLILINYVKHLYILSAKTARSSLSRRGYKQWFKRKVF